MAKIKSKVSDEPESAFTSMIDIVFLLLIFFILQPFKAPEMKLRSELPKDQGPSASSENMESIRMEVRKVAGNEEAAYFKVQMVRVDDPDRIFRALLQQANRDKNVPVVLDADMDVHFKWVLKALDQCYKAEMRDVKFAAPAPPGAARNEYMDTRRERDLAR